MGVTAAKGDLKLQNQLDLEEAFLYSGFFA